MGLWLLGVSRGLLVKFPGLAMVVLAPTVGTQGLGGLLSSRKPFTGPALWEVLAIGRIAVL